MFNPPIAARSRHKGVMDREEDLRQQGHEWHKGTVSRESRSIVVIASQESTLACATPPIPTAMPSAACR